MTTAKILFFDTETSGMITKKLPFDHHEQSWCVQIGAILTDLEGNELDRMNMIVKASGREMGYHAEQVHGISVEKADAEGYDELIVIDNFGALMKQASLIVCHNVGFDIQFVEQMMQRNLDDLCDESRSAFYEDTPTFCTMRDKVVKKYVGAKNKNNRLKFPKLVEVYEKLFGRGFENAHDAFADITATKDCFFALLDLGIIDDCEVICDIFSK